MADQPPDPRRLLFLMNPAPIVQRSLFSEDQAYEVLEQHGEFTGERLRERKPEVYQLVIRMIAEGLSTRSIARACSVSPNTVEAVRRTERISIDAQKQELLAMTRSAARLTLERVIELAPSMKPGEASVAFGIVTEKMLLLGGEATTIVGTTSDKMKHASFNDLIDSLPQADVTEIGSSGENPDQKAAGPQLPAPPDQVPFAPAADAESVVSKGKGAAGNTSGNRIADQVPGSDGSDRSEDEGGRGSAEGEGGHQS